ncbi:DNL-type zinc finger protein [Trichonephila clavata]|uniref:DNL-type zinc finger protein n=1 Tax=Trichonephila clavata TaxID=2740835 RepID=A0A8X6GXP3_TRICU|nr:DNL-type zinc finger protein [Trichonephila clavata]
MLRFNPVFRHIFSCFNKRCFVIRCNNYLKPIIFQNKFCNIENQYSFNISRQCSNEAYEHHSGSSVTSGAVGKIKPKLFLAFTCKICKARIEKHISKAAYTKGVVIVTCDGCKENHLIADNLGWFPNLQAMRNIEDFMQAQGETVKRTIDNDKIKE